MKQTNDILRMRNKDLSQKIDNIQQKLELALTENSNSKEMADRIIVDLESIKSEQEALISEIKGHQESYKNIISKVNKMKKYLFPKKLREYFR